MHEFHDLVFDLLCIRSVEMQPLDRIYEELSDGHEDPFADYLIGQKFVGELYGNHMVGLCFRFPDMRYVRTCHNQVQTVEFFFVISYHSGAGSVHDKVYLIFRMRVYGVAEFRVGTIENDEKIILGNRNDFLQNMIHSCKLVLLQIYVIISIGL